MMNSPNSLLIHFFALYTVRVKVANYHFVVMENLFPRNVPINEIYDLKGSMAGRYVPNEEVIIIYF